MSAKVWQVFASDGLDKDAEAALQKYGFATEVRKETPAADLHAAAKSADFIIIRSATKLGDKDFSALKNLKGVVRAGVGIDNIDLKAAEAHKIYVWNAPTGNFLATAEHAVALIFALFRAIPFAHLNSRDGKWSKKEASAKGRQLRGSTLGLMGAGNIGSRVAQIAQGVGMKVLVADPYLKTPFEGTSLVSFDELLERSDVISIHTPLTSETKNRFDEGSIAKMKKGAFLVNAARGGIINEKALLQALNSGQISGAALDVFAEEPFNLEDPTTKALLQHAHVIATPHIAASTKEAQKAVGLECAEKLLEVKVAAEKKDPTLIPKAFVNGVFEKLIGV